MAVQVNRQGLAAARHIGGRQHDVVDQLADELAGFRQNPILRRAAELCDLLAEASCHVRMQQHRAVFAVVEPGFQPRLFGFKRRDLVAHAASRHAIQQRLHQAVEIALDLLESAAVAAARRIVLAVKAVHLLRVFLAEQSHVVRLHQMILEAVENEAVHVIPADGQTIGACALGAGSRAAKTLGVEIHKAPAAHAAAHET